MPPTSFTPNFFHHPRVRAETRIYPRALVVKEVRFSLSFYMYFPRVLAFWAGVKEG